LLPSRGNSLAALRSTSSSSLLGQQEPCLSFLSPLCPGLEDPLAQKGKNTQPMPETMRLIPPHAAGSAGGAEEPWVCVPADRAAQPVQTLSALPCALPRLAAGSTAGPMTTVVLASPGVSWLPLWQSLAARGCAGARVKARHVQPGPGRPQTDRGAGRGRPTWPP
jgi:hypothetical protein